MVASGTYTVTVTSILGANLNTGGDFTGGTIGTMSTGYTLTTDGNLNDGYEIANNANVNNFGNNCTSSAPSGGNMMEVNGSNNGTTTVIQKSGLAVTAGSQYRFSFWYSDVYGMSNSAQLEVTVNGVVQTTLNMTAECAWQQYSFVFTAASSTASFKIVDKRTSFLGAGDVFAIDDLFVQEIIPCTQTATTNVVVNNPLMAGGVSGAKVWLRGDAGITKTGANVTTWADQSRGGFITTQATKAATANVTHVSPAFNHNPSVRFDGTANQRLVGAANANFTGAGTYFAVANIGSTTINSVSAIIGNSGLGGQGIAILGTSGTGTFYYHTDGNGAGETNTSNSSNVFGSYAQPRIVRSVYTSPGTNTQNSSLYLDGGVLGETSTSTGVGVAAASGFEIGGRTNGGFTARIWKGDIAEVIYYPSVLNATDLEKVESYLAIKYGITLGDNNATTSKYVNSDGVTIWSANTGFHRDVAGIGRDSLSALDQRQSSSSNTNNIVSMANAAFAADNSLNTNAFSADKSFLIWGHDGASTSFTAIAGTGLQVLGRKWRAEEIGTVGTAQLRLPNSLVTLAVGEKLVLIASSDATITTSDMRIDMTLNGSNYECTYNFPAGVSYFTVAKVVSTEGGLCNDGIDNDADGATDCNDSDCSVVAKTPAIRH